MSAPPVSALEIEETLAFVLQALPEPCRLLEVGCGRGELLAALGEAGHRVVGLEDDASSAAEARQRGLAVRRASFPEDDAGLEPHSFDALLFTRSLHHLAPLKPTLERARSLLRSGGHVVVEDWAWDEVDHRTASWAYGSMGLLRALGLEVDARWDVDGDPLDAWRRLQQETHHALPGAAAMLEELQRLFAPRRSTRAPYFYRYVARSLGADGAREPASRAALALERALIETGAIVPLGLRFVGRLA